MKHTTNILGLFLFLFIQGCSIGYNACTQKISADDGWKHWYGIGWRDMTDPSKGIKYAKQMGHDYIAINTNAKTGIYNNSNCSGMKFYIINPHKRWKTVFSNYSAIIDLTKSYTEEEKAWYEQRMLWKSNDTFPNNLASGWFNNSINFEVPWDFQQQAVINEVVEKAIELFRSYENSQPFTFAGYIIDVPKLTGEFYRWDTSSKKGVKTTLTNWTGTDSGLIHGTITHAYAKYSDGLAAFYKRLNTRMRAEFPNAKWIIDPYWIYDTKIDDEWVYQIKNRTDKDELTPDMLVQEGPYTDFVDNNNNFNSGLNITKDMVGCTQSNKVSVGTNTVIAAKAGINGAWYNWFGRFGLDNNSNSDMPDFASITEVYPRLKLVRCIPNWDNLNNVPVDGSSRTWNGSVYESYKDGKLRSYISSNVMYSRHPKTGKLFAVFNTTNGVIKLNTGESVTSVKRTDGYFIETVDGSADVTIMGNEIRLKSSVTIDVDSSNGQVKGKGYIITLSSGSGPSGSITINSGAAYTKSTAVTLNLSATDNIGVTGYYLSTSSTKPSATATGWTSVTSTASYSANVSYTLSSGDGSKTIYAWYKDSAGNVSATASDSITLDTTAPAITITSPTSNATYSTASSTISLGGTASDATSGVGSVTWSNSRGGSGTASGKTSWSVSTITLSSGSNVITVTVTDGAGNTGTDTITVTYSNTTPSGSININSGTAYTKSTNVTLNLSAMDNVGVTGYYLSTSSTVPLATATGWTAVTSTTSYNANVSYTLSSGDGSKTVYVWYKDAAGNVSATASDSITLDTTAPAITITSPTSNSTYSTVSGTISLGGSASDSTSGINNVTWSNDRGGSGTATGTTGWSVSGITLSGGSNVITVTAKDRANNTATDTITVTYNTGGAPSVTTGTATSITTNSATLKGTVNANGLSTTAWFDYGTTTGSYSKKSTTQTVNGTTGTSVSLSVSGLSSGSACYYRLAAQNSAGTSYGTERSFTTSALPTGVQSHYKFDEGSGSTASDSSGNGNDGTINGAAWTNGKSGKGLGFDGVNDSVDFNTNLGITGELTVGAWVYPTAAPDGVGRIIASTYDWDSNSALLRGWTLGINYGSDDKIQFVVLDSSGNSAFANSNNFFAENLNKWTHVTGVFKPSQYIRLYVNGSMVAENTVNIPGSIAYATGTNLRIGMRADNSSQSMWKGSIDEVKIYNYSLSGQEIQDLYNSANLMAHYALDEGSGTIAVDSSGNGNNGTISGGATFTTGKIGQALSFDGVNDYINIPNNTTLSPTGDMTLSAWVKFWQLGTDLARVQKIVYKGHNVTPWESYELMMDATNQIVFNRAGGTNSYAGAGYTGAVSKGVWYHIVGVSQGLTMKIYINGTDSTNWKYNDVSGSFLQSNMDLRIGNNPWNSEHFNGDIDDVRIYNYALSSQEVTNLYNNGL